MSILTNDIVVRALKTFVQTFLAFVALGVTEVVSLDSAVALATAALAAAISATWNAIASR
jgi:hypothetical protein